MTDKPKSQVPLWFATLVFVTAIVGIIALTHATAQREFYKRQIFGGPPDVHGQCETGEVLSLHMHDQTAWCSTPCGSGSEW